MRENVCEAILVWLNYVASSDKVFLGPGIACLLYFV